MWDKCEERLLRIKSTPIPRNFLEEAAQLTDRSIMWHFPIDNEQGIDTEVEMLHLLNIFLRSISVLHFVA